MISLGGHNGEVESKIDALLNELQLIWDEIGEYEENRNRMLHELKLECLEVYRRKVTAINLSRANMHQLLADIHREIVSVASELGDHPAMAQLEKRGLPLKQQLSELEPILTDIRRKKIERIRLFQDVRVQIQNLRNEIYSSPFSELPTQEQDLSIEKLDELQGELRALQKEKTERLPKVMDLINKIHGLCQVFDCDPLPTIRAVHPSLDDSSANHPRNLSDETIQRLNFTVQTMLAEKRSRMQQIQDLGTSLLELWNLLDTPAAEQQPFQHVTCNIAAAEEDFVAAGSLSQHIIEQAEAEVKRLEELKASKMKELVLKRRNDLDELCGKGHLVVDGLLAADDMLACVESGDIDLQELLANIEQHIGNVKEEMFSRKDIMEITEKWFAALEAERWLEEYNKDENRYNTTRGAHLNLMRAERARAKTNKIPDKTTFDHRRL